MNLDQHLDRLAPASTGATALPTITSTSTAAQAIAPTIPTAPPSIHVRALLTWLAIFPLVTIGLTVLAPISADWPPVVRALALTVVVVPLAVYLVVPQLLKLHAGTRRRRATRQG